MEVLIPNQQKQSAICVRVPDQDVKERFIRKPEVLSRTGLSNSTLYQRIQKKTFPAPMHPYGPRVSIWRERDIDNFLADILISAGKEVTA